jgi:spore germination protein YaaH
MKKLNLSALSVERVQFSLSLDAIHKSAVLDLDTINNALSDSNAQNVFTTLEKIDGVHSIEFNGHFGNSIYFTIDEEQNTDIVKQKIIDSLNELFALKQDNDKGEVLVYISSLQNSDVDSAIKEFAGNNNFNVIDNEPESEHAGCLTLNPKSSPVHYQYYYCLDQEDGMFDFFHVSKA